MLEVELKYLCDSLSQDGALSRVMSEPREIAVSKLTERIYQLYSFGIPSQPAESYRPMRVDKDEFIQNLAATIPIKKQPQFGWYIAEKLLNGSYFIKKDYMEATVHESYLQSPMALKIGMHVIYLHNRFHFQPGSYFMHFYGAYFEGDIGDYIQRYYFNTSPENIVPFQSSLFRVLDFYRIPYHYKCIVDPLNYSRCDHAVLYLPKYYTPIMNLIIEKNYSDWSPFFLPGKVLFTNEVKMGISSIESPPHFESFGHSISAFLAAEIIEHNTLDAERLRTSLYTNMFFKKLINLPPLNESDK